MDREYVDQIGERLYEVLEPYLEKGFQRGMWGTDTRKPDFFIWRVSCPGASPNDAIGFEYSSEMNVFGVWDSQNGGRGEARGINDLEVALADFEKRLRENAA